MRKNITKITVLSLFAAALVGIPALSNAQGTEANPPATSGQTAPAKSKNLVFRGKVGAIDTSAMTLKVGTREFAVTADTKITKDGKPATLADATVGEPASGAYKKTDDGKLTATTIHFGAKAEPKNQETPATGANP